MAPPPEYDKEPKAPDKSATNISTEDSKLLHNLINDQHTNSDHKPTNTAATVEVENNKHVETLDDGQLRALLDEAITYKCPKDREGKSSLFKELLEEVEQDEQACEAAARVLPGGRGARRGRGRRALPHSNSLQDLVAALAAEPAPRRAHVRHAPSPAPSNVSARAIHGGSLPSGVDTSSLLSEEPARGAGYLATVRCVNPPPLAERRVSASDANAPGEMELLNRRSKPMFPMTYTARATLEIGSGSVCSGRAVTTTTPSNQVRTLLQARLLDALRPKAGGMDDPLRAERTSVDAPQYENGKPRGPNRLDQRVDNKSHGTNRLDQRVDNKPHGTNRLDQRVDNKPRVPNPLDQLMDNKPHDPNRIDQHDVDNKTRVPNPLDQRVDNKPHGPNRLDQHVDNKPRGPNRLDQRVDNKDERRLSMSDRTIKGSTEKNPRDEHRADDSQLWADNIDRWYKNLWNYTDPRSQNANLINLQERNIQAKVTDTPSDPKNIESTKIENNFILPFVKTSGHNNSPDLSLKDNLNINHICDLPEKDIVNEFKAEESLDFYDVRHHDEGAHRVVESFEFDKECDIKLRKNYRKQVGEHLVVPTLSDINPRNVRRMTIGQPPPHIQQASHSIGTLKEKRPRKTIKKDANIIICSNEMHGTSNSILNDVKSKLNKTEGFSTKSSQLFDSSTKCYNSSDEGEDITWFTNPFGNLENVKSQSGEVELTDVTHGHSPKRNIEDSFTEYVSKQQKLLESIENSEESNIMTTTCEYEKEEISQALNVPEYVTGHSNNGAQYPTEQECSKSACVDESEVLSCANKPEDERSTKPEQEHTTKSNRIILTQLPNNAYIFLTLPKPLVSPSNSNVNTAVQIFEIENYNDNKPLVTESNSIPNIVKKKRQKMPPEHPGSREVKKSAIDKNVLKVLLLESLFKNNANENLSHNSGVSAIANDEVDSAISFSCITTPEVVSSCNTTSSTAQSTVAVDPKPRSVISSSFNGLPLSRPNYGSTGTSASDDYKKSLDENGNSVQGFSSPLSGSSQHKKPRRKKSSKNETVIDCQQIDGYQGDKDVNELLRFIESNADNGRGAKLGRVKHKDDSDDKSKKRSTERRKDKENKIKRATSMEELSRTKMEDLTDVAAPPLRGDKKERRDAPAKERRSWGDDALYSDAPDPAAELTDFQTVTKKRKPRRRADDPPRRARAPSPRARRESAPPSDRSNDSNDDMDSVHSLPAAPPPAPPAPPPPPVASYADIARTRHNIPDLIESCNFYADGSGAPGAAPPDADGYPALEARAEPARRRDKAPPRRKERAPPAPAAPDCPAPDVVADRRPPVILLDSAARPRDMDGVTFGFDINEQLLSGAARRPRCDLLRDAPEPGAGGAGVAVRAGCAALRYMPPDAPRDTAHLLQIVDYVGAAWEDVVRCGAGKVRYFSE